MALQISEFGIEDLNGLSGVDQGVALCEAEQAQHLLRGGVHALALLGVQGKLFDGLAFHGQTQLSLDEGLHEQGQEVQGEQGQHARI